MKVFKTICKITIAVTSLLLLAESISRLLKLSKKMENYDKRPVFGAIDKNYEDEFTSDSVAAAFSGANLNFKDSTISGEEAELDLFGRFSGFSVKVPDNWNVKMSGKDVKSGVSKRFKDNSEVEDAPVLNINYDLKYSGLDVSND